MSELLFSLIIDRLDEILTRSEQQSRLTAGRMNVFMQTVYTD